MASKNRSIAIFLMSLVLFHVTTYPLAAAQLSGTSGIVSGLLCCTSNGSCPGIVLPNVTVALRCTDLLGNVRTIATSLTSATGAFSFLLSPVTVILLGLLSPTNINQCNVMFPLPLSSAVCPVLNGVTGSLSTPLPVGTLTGNLLNITIGGFTVRV